MWVDGSRIPIRIDHEAQRQSLRLSGGLGWRDAVHGRQHAAMTKRERHIGLRSIAFELKLHEPVQGNRHDRVTLDVDAEVADVPGHDTGKAGRAALVRRAARATARRSVPR